MFKEKSEGQTHYQNDGCGEPAHNQPTPESKEPNRIKFNSDGTIELPKGIKTKKIIMNPVNKGNIIAEGTFKYKPESKDRQGFEIQEDGAITTESKEDVLVNIGGKFKKARINFKGGAGRNLNPSGDGETYFCVVESEEDYKIKVKNIISSKGLKNTGKIELTCKLIRSEKKKSYEEGYDKAINEEYKDNIAEHLKSQAKEEMKKDIGMKKK